MSNPELQLPEVAFYSFWRPEQSRSKDKSIKLKPFGSLNEVGRKLYSLPYITGTISSPAFVGKLPIITLIWRVSHGVILRVKPEYTSRGQGKVYTITAASAVDNLTLFRLYVQIYEHLGAVLFDENLHDFVSLGDFKERVQSGQ